MRIRTLISASAVACLAALVLAAPSSAAPQTEEIPLSSLDVAPASGTLANHVDWEVDRGGPWSTFYYHMNGTGIGVQTWTFDREVSLRFGVQGFNAEGEGLRLPVGTQLESLNEHHAWDPDAGIVSGPAAGPSNGDESVFTLDGVTELVLDATCCNPQWSRGVSFIEVTASVEPPTVDIAAPVDGATYHVGQGVAADYTCADDREVVSCEGDVANGELIDTSTPGQYTFTVDAVDDDGLEASASVTYNVVAPVGVCRGTPISALGLTPATANRGETPCYTDNKSVVALNQPERPRRGILDLGPLLHQMINAGVLDGDTDAGDTSAAASADVADVNLLLPGILALSLKGVHSEASAELGDGCDDVQLKGKSQVGTLTINGQTHNIGAGPERIDLVIGQIWINQTVEEQNTITQRAVFVDLPGTALDIAISESKAGIAC